MKYQLILLAAMAISSPAMAQSAPEHRVHAAAVEPSAEGQQRTPTPAAPAENRPSSAHAEAGCCSERAPQPCQMPCCASMRRGASEDSGAPTQADDHAAGHHAH